MLILARSPGESPLLYPSEDIDPNMTVRELFANGPIKIWSHEVKGNQTKIGIEAPSQIRVMRLAGLLRAKRLAVGTCDHSTGIITK